MRSSAFFPLPLLVFFTGFVTSPSAEAQGDEGLFARLETSVGVIRAALDYVNAPLTVGNFVGLAEGSQAAIDPRNGRLIQGGFYDGMLFHRVINGALIQTGALDTTDPGSGPGYVFPSESTSSITHAEPYVLAMASTSANQNGSQFIITSKADASLNGVFPAFGRVVEGQEVVQSIAAAATGALNRPFADITLERVTIERLGAAAQAFDPSILDLPKVRQVSPTWVHDAGKAYLDLHFEPNNEYRLYRSVNLREWTLEFHELMGAVPADSLRDLTNLLATQRTGFFRLTETHYPELVLAPSRVSNHTLVLDITHFDGLATQSQITYDFDSLNGGTARVGAGPAVAFQNHSYAATGPTTASLNVPSSLIRPLDLVQAALVFIDFVNGSFSATLPRAVPPVTIRGTFTLTENP